jgi:hypothetical protein
MPKMQISGRWFVAAAMLVAACLAGGCQNGRVKAVWEEDLAPMLPAGYQGFRVEVNGYDNGVKIFSFEPPPESNAGQVLQKTMMRITRQYPCYHLITSSDAWLAMECATPTERHRRMRRVEFVTASDESRVFGMTISNDHTAELQRSYERTLFSLAGRTMEGFPSM